MAGVSETRTYDALLTTTLANFSETLRDQIFDDYPLLSWLNGKLGQAVRGGSIKRLQNGGETIVEHLLYEMNSAVNSYSGYEQVDTTPQEGMTIARYNWKQYSGPISINGLEKRSNMGEAQLINLLRAKTEQTVMSVKDLMSRDAWGDGTGNSSKALTGLQAHASTTTTLGGINPSTFSWWQADVTTSAGSFAANGESSMRTTYNNITFGTQKPEIIFTDQTNFERFEGSQVDRRRYTSERVANVGFDNIMFKSAPVVFDRDCEANAMYFMVPGVWSFVVHPDADMKVGPFITPENQDASTALILFQGNITSNNRRKVGVIRGFTD